MKNIAVIFDMDGVIFDSERVWKKCFFKTNKFFNIKFNEKFRQQFCGSPRKENKKILLDNFPKMNADAYWDHLCDEVDKMIESKGVPLKKGFQKLISFLKENKIKTGLVSGNMKDKLDKQFAKVEINPNEIFNVIITSENYTLGKPHPMPYQMACEKLETLPENAYVLEDAYKGIQSAHAAGCKAIMVVDLLKPTKEIKPLCFKITKNLNQVQKFLKKELEIQKK